MIHSDFRLSGLASFLALITTFFLTTPLCAATVEWDGDAGNGLWSTSANWSGDELPIASSSVVIGGGITVHADIDATVAGLKLEGIGTTLVVDSGTTLTLNGTSIGQPFFIGGSRNLINNGTIEQLNGQLTAANLTNAATGVVNSADTLSLWNSVNHGQINTSSSVQLSGSIDNHGDFNVTNGKQIRYWASTPDAFTNHPGANLNVTGWLLLGYAPDPSSRDGMFVNNGSVFADAQGFTHGMAISSSTTIVNTGTLVAVDPIELACGADLIDTGTVTGSLVTTCHTWTGLGATDNWSEAANWSFSTPPVSGGSSDVYLKSTNPIQADVSIDLGTGKTLLATGTTLNVNTGKTIGVSGQFDNDGTTNVLGTLQVNASGFVKNEGLLDNGGTVDNSGEFSNGCDSGSIIQQPGSTWIGNAPWEECPDWDGGGADSLWSNPLNWTSDSLPYYLSKVTIGEGANVNVDANTTVAGLVLQGAGTALTVDAGITLTLNGSSIGQPFFVGGNGSLTNNGTIELVRGQLTAANLTNAATGVVNAADILSTWNSVNHGQINAAFHVYLNGSIDNHGGINVSSGKNIRYWGKAPDAFTNHLGATMSITGWLALGNGSNPASTDGSFINKGTLNATAAGFTHGNAITVDMFTLNEGTLIATPIQNNSVLHNECGAVLTGTVNGNPVVQLPCNTPPVANDDAYDALEDTPLIVPAPGVLANDTDVDGDPLTAAVDSTTGNGSLSLNSNGSFTYTPDPDYCGPDSFTYHANDGTVDSNVATVSITVTCVNDPPNFTVENPAVDEDTGPHADVPVTSGFVAGPPNESTQKVMACILSNFSDLAAPNNVLTAAPSVSVNATEDGCEIDFDTALNQFGSVTFDLQIQDNGGTENGGVDTSTPPQQVTITVNPVNDPPYLKSVTPASQTVQYSDDINEVRVLVRDIDSPLSDLSLAKSGEPADLDTSSLVQTTPCAAWDSVYTGVGSECTWKLEGQVLVPGDVDYDILFTPDDGDAATDGISGTHTLSVVFEDATVRLDSDNDVAVLGDDEGNINPFYLYFTAWETNDVDPPFGDSADMPLANANANADEYDFVTDAPFDVIGRMTLSPVGPGAGTSVDCVEDSRGGVRPYGEYIVFECMIPADSLAVNVYEVKAEVDGDAENRYFHGFDEDAVVVFDPSLGFTTGGGWFYWPGTEIDTCLEYEASEPFDCLVENPDPCAGHPGDKTNFGYVMKYNKKGQKVQGGALVMRHTLAADGDFCVDAGNFRVKSNALYGLALGDGDDPDDFGWASFAGKATYREPLGENEGNHLFFIYAEDHGEQGCGQNPSDRFWVEVWDKDDVTVMSPPMGPDAAIDAVDVQCGNIYVPHKQRGGKR